MNDVDLESTLNVPGSADAEAKGCICPGADAQKAVEHEILLKCGGLLFSPLCPVHRFAVQAEAQRMFRWPQ